MNFEGKFYRVKNFRLTVPPPAKPVRVVLAALGPEMLELAGEIADGVVLNWIPPETVPASIGHLESGARKAGRSLADFEIASFIRTCVTDDPTAARETLARDITGYATVDAYASFFRTAGFGDEVDALNAAWRAGDRSGAVKQVSPRFLEGLGVVGPEAFCRERIAEFTRAGLTQPVIVPFAPGGGDAARLSSGHSARSRERLGPAPRPRRHPGAPSVHSPAPQGPSRHRRKAAHRSRLRSGAPSPGSRGSAGRDGLEGSGRCVREVRHPDGDDVGRAPVGHRSGSGRSRRVAPRTST